MFVAFCCSSGAANFNLHWHSFHYRRRTFRVSLSYVAAALLPYLCHKRRAYVVYTRRLATIEVRAYVFFFLSPSLSLYSSFAIAMCDGILCTFSTYSCIYTTILAYSTMANAHNCATTHFAHIARIVNACYQRSKTSSSSTATTTRATADQQPHTQKTRHVRRRRTRNISMSGIGR